MPVCDHAKTGNLSYNNGEKPILLLFYVLKHENPTE